MGRGVPSPPGVFGPFCFRHGRDCNAKTASFLQGVEHLRTDLVANCPDGVKVMFTSRPQHLFLPCFEGFFSPKQKSPKGINFPSCFFPKPQISSALPSKLDVRGICSKESNCGSRPVLEERVSLPTQCQGHPRLAKPRPLLGASWFESVTQLWPSFPRARAFPISSASEPMTKITSLQVPRKNEPLLLLPACKLLSLPQGTHGCTWSSHPACAMQGNPAQEDSIRSELWALQRPPALFCSVLSFAFDLAQILHQL